MAAFAKSDGEGQLITFTKEDFTDRVTGEESLSAIVMGDLPSGGVLRLAGTDVRDKDGVNACMLIAEAACWYKKNFNKTLVDAIDMLYQQYGYYGDKVVSFVCPGKDGLETMQNLRFSSVQNRTVSEMDFNNGTGLQLCS